MSDRENRDGTLYETDYVKVPNDLWILFRHLVEDMGLPDRKGETYIPALEDK